MKRSEINDIMKQSASFLKTMNFLLPPFEVSEQFSSSDTDLGRIASSVLPGCLTPFCVQRREAAGTGALHPISHKLGSDHLYLCPVGFIRLPGVRFA